MSRYLDSLMRHAQRYLEGHRDEDHLAAVAWNAMAMMHVEEIGSADLMDLPDYTAPSTNQSPAQQTTPPAKNTP